MKFEGGVFPQEDGGICQPEPIDGLLHIAHGEQIFPLPGNCLKNVVLDLVGILILVHEDFPVAGGDLLPQLRGVAVLIRQQLQRQMLLIGEICRIQPQLFFSVALRKFRRQR